MTGLELSRGFFRDYGLPMLRESFPHLLPYLAAGFVGSGSERYGFDDEVSRDHDFEPGFSLYLPGEDVVSRKDAFLLERAYAKLPNEYRGHQRERLSPVGGSRNGPVRTRDFYLAKVGTPDGSLTPDEWLRIPDYVLAEAVNGEVFFDEYGEFSAIRKRLFDMPEDVRIKRIAGNLLLMAQSGQYNFARCLLHGEPEAAMLACNEFVLASLKCIFLLHRRYMPYYKWSFRSLRRIPGTEQIFKALSMILHCPGAEKQMHIETAAQLVCEELRSQSLTVLSGAELERIAYSVNDSVRDNYVRTLDIFAGV